MKQTIILLLLFLLSFSLLAQTTTPNFSDSITKKIKKNIYRVALTQPLTPDYETTSILSANYEHQIIKAFAIVAKLGIGASVKTFGDAGNRYQTSFHLFEAIEGRYYFSLYRRLKRNKSILNFSGPYISLEQNLFTNPIALINQNKKDAINGSSSMFANIGYQRQISKLYLAAFFGGQLSGRSLSKYSGSSTTSIHGGVMVGIAF